MTEIHWQDEVTENDVSRREFLIHRGERPVPGVLWQPENPIAGSPMVLYGHGASGDRHQRPIPYLAQKLALEASFFGLAIDGPVHGRRKVGEGGRAAFGVEWRREGAVDDMVADWKTAIDVVRAEESVAAGRLGYYGLSMGTIFGVPLVGAEPRIEVAVLGLMGLVGVTEAYRQQLDSAAGYIRCPVFFIMQLEDELFSRDRCLALFDRIASEDKRLHASPGLHPEFPREEVEFAAAFLHRHLIV